MYKITKLSLKTNFWATNLDYIYDQIESHLNEVSEKNPNWSLVQVLRPLSTSRIFIWKTT